MLPYEGKPEKRKYLTKTEGNFTQKKNKENSSYKTCDFLNKTLSGTKNIFFAKNKRKKLEKARKIR